MATTIDRDHGEVWDVYVREWREGRATPGLKNPGDHWGTPATWKEFFYHLIRQHVPIDAERFVEIGQGSGKYTEMILAAYPNSHVVCYDVSKEFLAHTRSRLSEYANKGRLDTVQIGNDYRSIYKDLERREWLREVDCFCSFDAMVHVDMQYLIAYYLTAMEALKDNGILSMTVADITSDKGFAHLLSDLPHVFPFEGRSCMQFRWQSPEIVKSVLARLGFNVEFMPPIGGDIEFVAKLVNRQKIDW